MQLNKELFEKIKDHKFDEVMELLDNKMLDINIRDTSNTYLIQYAIMYNKSDIVKKILKKNCKIDFIDTETGHSILHVPIKHNYKEIIELLLNNTNIAMPLTDIVDKFGSLAVHYACSYSNNYALKMLLEKGTNINKTNNKGDAPLHIVIKKENIEGIKMLLEYNKVNTNIRTNIGETPLHIACNYEFADVVERLLENKSTNINNYDYEHHTTPLMYVTTWGNTKLVKLLLKYNADPDQQDVLGNSSLHMAILEDRPYIANILINHIKEFNNTNIESMTALHLLIDDNKDIDVLRKYDTDTLLWKTNLNIQDINGNTIWHKIAKGLWVVYKDILVNKKNNVFIKNNENVTPYEIVHKVESSMNKKEFDSMIIDSYYNTLVIDRDYITEWENICKKKEKKDKEMCIKKISENYKNKISIPQKKSVYCKIIVNTGKNIVESTYKGFTIDIMSGLLLLHNKYKNIMSSLNNNIVINTDLMKHYRQSGIQKTYDFLNFEIIWLHQNIFFPDNFTSTIQKFIKSENRFFVAPIGIEIGIGSAHANILLYDKKTNTMERFEPNGSTMPSNYNYNCWYLDKLLMNYFGSQFKNMTYLTPAEFLPKIGFQMYENIEYYKTRKLSDPGGYCGAWCTWYIDNRLEYSEYDIDASKLVKYLIKKIKNENYSFKNLIRNYSKVVTDIRDGLLANENLDVNDYYNNNYTENNINNIEAQVKMRLLQ